MKKEKKERWKKNYKYLMISFLLIALIIIIVAYYKKLDQELKETEVESMFYDKYYAVIFTDEKGEYESTLLQGIQDVASEKNVYVKEIGEELSFNLTKEEKMDLAIAEKVDGIIVQGDNSEAIKDKINQADKEDIPVITITEDCFESLRKSFVGNSRYETGRTFARQVIDIATTKTKEVMILDSDNMVEENNLFLSGFKETMVNEGNHLSINLTVMPIGGDPFEAEEQIRGIVLDEEEKPDILLVLDEGNTNSVIQTLVDYNMVGEMKVIGFASSKIILDAISKEIIYSSVYLDSYKIGADSVKALIELDSSGYVNSYKTVDVSIINKKNVHKYMEEGVDE